MAEYNWKLISAFSIPAGLITGWMFTTGLNVFIKYIALIAVLALTWISVNNLSSSQKKPNAFTAATIIILITLMFYLFKHL